MSIEIPFVPRLVRAHRGVYVLCSSMPCLRQSLAALTLLMLSGCEIIASFDRDKIPTPALVTPEAGAFTPAPPERDGGRLPMDAGSDAGPDAGRDAGMDGGLGDAALGDAALGDAGPG